MTSKETTPLTEPTIDCTQISRRKMLRYGLSSVAGLVSTQLVGCAHFIPQGNLLPADANGLMLLPGYVSRIVAHSDQLVGGTTHRWHGSPDGGATYATGDGGWIYVSNSELPGGAGGAGAIRFDAFGDIVDAYPILSGTNKNCAGGKTPWDTWLSCEENDDEGRVFECDPFGINAAIERPALGRFNHEAAAVDDNLGQLYLTEDKSNGRLYRFTPANYPDLSAGLLEVAQVIDNVGADASVIWHEVPDPSAQTQSTRSQVLASTGFNGGEGIIYRTGIVYFTTKGDNRVWAYDTLSQTVYIIYDDNFFVNPFLTGVDGIVDAPSGDILVAEDLGNMQVVAINDAGEASPLLQVQGHIISEVTGIAFDPSGTRFYFSSQRGATGSTVSGGITYEVSGPF